MRILCLVALAVLSGCASQSQTAATSAPAAKTAVAEASEVKDAAPTSAQLAAAEKKEFVPPPGYRERLEDGITYYCAKIVVLGSRFAKDDCHTQSELEEMEVQKASMRGNMTQRNGVCGSTGGCGAP